MPSNSHSRKKSFSLSDSAASPVASIDTSSIYPSREPSPRSSMSVKDVILKTPSSEKRKDGSLFGKKSMVENVRFRGFVLKNDNVVHAGLVVLLFCEHRVCLLFSMGQWTRNLQTCNPYIHHNTWNTTNAYLDKCSFSVFLQCRSKLNVSTIKRPR